MKKHDLYGYRLPLNHTARLSASCLPTGNQLVAWQDDSNDYKGTYAVRSPSGEIVGEQVIFSNGRTDYISTVPLPDGNILIAYSAYENTGHGEFVIVSPIGELVGHTITFKKSNVSHISPAVLQNGNILIAYSHDLDLCTGDCDISDVGEFIIVDPTGVVVVRETMFNQTDTDMVIATSLPNGKVQIGYWCYGITGSKTVTVSSSGELDYKSDLQ